MKEMNEIQINIVLDWIKHLANKIRGDWSDPRWECRCIWEAVDLLKNEPEPYQQIMKDGQLIEEYITEIQGLMNKKEDL